MESNPSPTMGEPGFFPAANVNLLDETVATDNFFFADTRAHDDGIMGHGGAKKVQLYAGKTSQYTCIFPMQFER
jgi:hypothetical protein